MVDILVDQLLTVVDDRAGLAFAVLCVLVAGKKGFDVHEGFPVGERADTAEAVTVKDEVGDDALPGSLGSRGGALLQELEKAAGDPREGLFISISIDFTPRFVPPPVPACVPAPQFLQQNPLPSPSPAPLFGFTQGLPATATRQGGPRGLLVALVSQSASQSVSQAHSSVMPGLSRHGTPPPPPPPPPPSLPLPATPRVIIIIEHPPQPPLR